MDGVEIEIFLVKYMVFISQLWRQAAFRLDIGNGHALDFSGIS